MHDGHCGYYALRIAQSLRERLGTSLLTKPEHKQSFNKYVEFINENQTEIAGLLAPCMLAGVGLYEASENGSTWKKHAEAIGNQAQSILVSNGHCYLFEKTAHVINLEGIEDRNNDTNFMVTIHSDGKTTAQGNKDKPMKGWFKKKSPLRSLKEVKLDIFRS